MGRKQRNTTQISCRVSSLALQTLGQHARQLGYTGQGDKVLWGEYLAAIAAEIVRGDIDLPHRIDRDKR